jgi:quercetin dioxygenase-like cupin family protein
MKSIRHTLLLALVFVIVTVTFVWAQDSASRKELRRADLSGAPGMEVILSLVELKPGDVLVTHTHHGIEAAYVLEGGMVEAHGKQMAIPAGAPMMNLRDVPHGFKVVGDKTIKLFTVHIADKGKPLYDYDVKK